MLDEKEYIEYVEVCAKCEIRPPAPYRPKKGAKLETRRLYATLCKECRKEISEGTGAKRKQRKGDRYIDSMGYTHIRMSDGCFRPEHRIVMEGILGRPLVKGEIVHHKNGAKSDNSPGNLELWVTPHVMGSRAKDTICPHCGRAYLELS